MRTTVDLDPEVIEAARALARVRRVSLGRALSDLARSALAPATDAYERADGFPVFRVPADAPPITDAMVAEALDEW